MHRTPKTWALAAALSCLLAAAVAADVDAAGGERHSREWRSSLRPCWTVRVTLTSNPVNLRCIGLAGRMRFEVRPLSS